MISNQSSCSRKEAFGQRRKCVLDIWKCNGLLSKADITYHTTDCNIVLTFSVVKFSSRSRKLSS